MSEKILIIALLVLFASMSGCTTIANQAHQDIARGHLQLRGYGLPTPDHDDYVRLLTERYGVEYRRVAGCVVTSDLMKQTDEYNQIMTAEIERRFGAGALTDSTRMHMPDGWHPGNRQPLHLCPRMTLLRTMQTCCKLFSTTC